MARSWSPTGSTRTSIRRSPAVRFRMYHPYVGHDNNRDMYMFTQKESQLTAKLLWHDWFPAVWLDEHQQGSGGARIFVMPATDPINPTSTVDLSLERHPRPVAGGRARGCRQGRHHLQLHLHQLLAGRDGVERGGTTRSDLLTEVASVRVAAPTEQQRAVPGLAPAPGGGRGAGGAGAATPAACCHRRPTSTRAPSIHARGWAAAGPCATSSTTS